MRKIAGRPLLNDRIAIMNIGGRIHAWYALVGIPASHCENEFHCDDPIATGLLLVAISSNHEAGKG